MHPNYKPFSFASIIVLALFALTVNAAPILNDVILDRGSTLNTEGLANNAANGGTMGGIEVTVRYSDNTTDTASWNAGTGSAGTADWTLGFSDPDTLNGFWMLENKSTQRIITNLRIDGQPGGVVFDIVDMPIVSPGSGIGSIIQQLNGPDNLPVNATYRNQVAVNGIVHEEVATQIPDLFSLLDIGFVGGLGNTATSGPIAWIADTDNVATQLIPIPEPTSLSLLGLAFAGLGVGNLRKKRTPTIQTSG